MIIRTKGCYQQALPPDVHHIRSSNPCKMYRYGQEPYLQEGSYSLRTELDGDLGTYGRFTFVLLKPDAFVARAGGRILDVLERRAFKVRGAQKFRFNRLMWRELWRYELNIARVERYPLIDELLMSGPSLFVLLEDVSGAPDGSQRLTRAKGNSDPAQRNGCSVRAEIGARAGTLNFVHCPDEFIDFVRELGVLWTREQCGVLARQMDGCDTQDVAQMLAEVEQEYPQHPLELKAVECDKGAVFSAALAQIEDSLRLAPYSVRDELCSRFDLSKWDWITIAATFLKFSHANMPRVFEYEVSS